MPPPRSTQAIAICASVWPRPAAMSFSLRMLAIASALSTPGSSDLPWVARLSSGMPFRYLSVSMPCASGVKAIDPTPSSASVSFSPSRSTQRFSML